MKILCIAEKPDAARAFAQALSPSFETKKGYLVGSNQITYCYAYGHLLTQVEPHEIDGKYKEWCKEDLPILPEKIPLKVIPGKETQLNIIKTLAKEATIIYNCCDAGSEGQAIFMRIYSYLNLQKPVKRVWTSSLQPKAIIKAFEEAKDNQAYQHLTEAGILRSESDWLIGMNSSRAASLATNAKIRAGRVLLPVLSIIYDREKEREEFKKTLYYVLNGDFQQNDMVYVGERIYENGYPIELREVEQAKQQLISNPCEIILLEKEVKKKAAPKLLDLTELSRVANKHYGYKASETLSILQELYLKKVVTYPRTSSSYVTEAEIPLMHASFDILAEKFPQLSQQADKKFVHTGNKRICDASKVEDHHAILPEPVIPPNDLSADEVKIYQLVLERFFAQFYSESVFEHLKVITSCGTERFVSYFKAPIELGWLQVLSSSDEENEENVHTDKEMLLKALPNLIYGPVTCRDTDIKSQETTPPPAFTDGTLIQLMKNISRRVNDPTLKKSLNGKGIGTAATRGEIIKKLEEYQYTVYKNKSIEITKLGKGTIDLFRNTKITTLTSPEFTALWEQKLDNIQKGVEGKESFQNRIREFCTVIVNEFNVLPINTSDFEKEGVAICPKCKNQIVESKTRFYCSDYKNGCTFFLWKKQFGKNITASNLKQLIEKGKTNKLSFTAKTGNKYSGRLILTEEVEEGRLKMEFINS